MPEHPGRLEVCLGAGEVAELAVELGQADMQVGGGPRVRLVPCGGLLQGLLVQPAGAAGPARSDPHVGEHHRGVELVDQVARGVQAADRLGERRQRLLDVAGRPGGQTEVSRSGPADEVVLRSGHVQGPAGVTNRARDVAACLGQRRAVDRDRRRRGAQVFGVRPRRREVLVARARGQRRFGIVEPGLDRVEVTGHQHRPAGHDAEDRAPAHHVLRQRPHPGQQHAVLPGAAHLRKRFLHQVGGTVEVLGRERVPDRIRDEVVGGVPGAGPPVQVRHLVGVLGEQARAEDVGEQVVVAVPGALGVERDEEEVAALEVLQRPGAVGAAGDGVAQGAGEVGRGRRCGAGSRGPRRVAGPAPRRRGSR